MGTHKILEHFGEFKQALMEYVLRNTDHNKPPFCE